jgi:hypothetical protein
LDEATLKQKTSEENLTLTNPSGERSVKMTCSQTSQETLAVCKENSSKNFEAIQTLREKINWALVELKTSVNARYNIELCEMIKAASETIKILRDNEIL